MARKSYLRNSSLTPLKDAISEFIEFYRLRGKMDENKVLQSWGKVVGPMVSKHTEKLKIRNRKLFVRVDSDPVRNELLFARKKLVAALNREAGAEVIDEIILT